jgi:hypothetical protein
VVHADRRRAGKGANNPDPLHEHGHGLLFVHVDAGQDAGDGIDDHELVGRGVRLDGGNQGAAKSSSRMNETDPRMKGDVVVIIDQPVMLFEGVDPIDEPLVAFAGDNQHMLDMPGSAAPCQSGMP